MATKRDQRFYGFVWRRMQAFHRAYRSPDPDAVLIEQCRNSVEVLLPELLVYERAVEGLCYFEYAYMTPYQRDQLFLETFNAVVKEKWPKRHMRGMGAATELAYPWVHPHLEFNVPEVRSAIRSARQHFDAMGLQYGVGLRCIVDEGILYNGAYGVPRPNQLTSHLALDALDTNREWLKERSHAPFEHGKVDARFLAENHVWHWAQERALEAVTAHVMAQHNRPKALARYLSLGVISEQEARVRLGDALVDESIAEYGPAKFAQNGGGSCVERTDRPACIGLAHDANDETCSTCPVAAECRGIRAKADAGMVAVTGFSNPRVDRAREGAKFRKRNSRAAKTPEHRAVVAAVLKQFREIFGPRFKRK